MSHADQTVRAVRPRPTAAAAAAMALAAIALAPPRATAATTYGPPTPVALSGTAAPAGGNYGSFDGNRVLNVGDPVLNGAGQVAFFTNLTGGSATAGVFAGAPGSLQPVALQNTAAPAGGNYSSFQGNPVLNASGRVAFSATLTGGSANAGIFAGTPGSLQAAALQGIAAPAGGNYDGFGNPSLNGVGQVAFLGGLTGGASTRGVFAGSAGSIQAVAVTGIVAPAGGNYSTFPYNPALNGSGRVAFFAGLTGGSSTGGDFTGTPGSLQAAALQNTAAPAGGNYSGFRFLPALNGSGQVAFCADLTGGSSTHGIFAGAPGSIQVVALENTAAPAGGKYVALSDSPVINGTGQVAFFAQLIGGSAAQGVFAGVPGSIQAVALSGSAAPVSAGSAANYGAVSQPTLNALGQVAFTAFLGGPGITSANNAALFAGSPGNVTLVVREGDLIDVDAGAGIDNRTVADTGINFLSVSGGEDGRGMSFNDDGLLVYRLTFTDGSSGVFTSAVPEPTGLLPLAALAVGLGRRRRPRTA